MHILVSGGTGFVGRHVVAGLARTDDVVTVQRRLGTADHAGVRQLSVDLADLAPGQLRAMVGAPMDVIVHLAARLDDPFGTDRSAGELAASNVVATIRLLEAAVELGVRRFVHGSTGGVGLNPPAGSLMHEDDGPGPVNPYGLTKHLAEQAVRAYRWPFERVSLRYFAPYGRDGSNPLFKHLVDCVDQSEPIETGRDGGPTLNPIHIDDAVAATIRALAVEQLPAVINVAGPDVVSLAELSRLIGHARGREPVLHAADDLGLNWAADIARMRDLLWEPQVGIAAGIAREFGGAETDANS